MREMRNLERKVLGYLICKHNKQWGQNSRLLKLRAQRRERISQLESFSF
jgi:hypothetical protein